MKIEARERGTLPHRSSLPLACFKFFYLSFNRWGVHFINCLIRYLGYFLLPPVLPATEPSRLSFLIFRLLATPDGNFEPSGADAKSASPPLVLQAAPRCKQAGKRRTLRPPVPEFRTPMSIGGALAKFEPS